MAVKLEKPLKREVMIRDEAYTLTLTRFGLKVVKKGRRLGVEFQWQAFVDGNAELALALRAATGQVESDAV